MFYYCYIKHHRILIGIDFVYLAFVIVQHEAKYYYCGRFVLRYSFSFI